MLRNFTADFLSFYFCKCGKFSYQDLFRDGMMDLLLYLATLSLKIEFEDMWQ